MTQTELDALAQKQRLTQVQYFYFGRAREADATDVFNSLRSGRIWLPLKCAVALRRFRIQVSASQYVDDDFLLAFYITEALRIPELPKPMNSEWHWHLYGRVLEADSWSEADKGKFRQKENMSRLLECFLSSSLRDGKYSCVACGMSFNDYDELFDVHVLRIAGHAEEFNSAIVRRRLPGTVLAS